MLSQRRTSSSIRPTAAALGVVVAGVLPVHLTGALAPVLQADLGFGDATLGIVVGLYFGLSALMTAAGGHLADRVGPRRALRFAVATSGLGLAMLGTVVDSVAAVALALAVAAVGNSIAQPGANVLIARAVGPARQGLALGIKQSAIAVSTALSGLVAALLAGRSWHIGYLAALTVAICVLTIIPDSAAPVTDAGARARVGLRGLTNAPGVVPVVLTGLAGAAAVSSIAAFMVRAGVDAGWSDRAAGLILTGGSVVLIVARISWGALADRGRIDPLVMVGRLLTVGLLGYAALATGSKLGVLVGAAIAFGAGWSWPGLIFLGVVRAFPDRPGAMSGIAQTGMFIGAFAGPLGFGLVAEHVSLPSAWWLSGAWSAVAAVAATRMARLAPKAT